MSESGLFPKSEITHPLTNSMLSVLREARLTVNERLPLVGEKRFLAECVAKLQPGMADIPYPLHNVPFEFVAGRKEAISEVVFSVPVDGDVRVFSYLSSQFIRPVGVLGTGERGRLRLSYRITQFNDAVQLHQMFLNDIDQLRQYLQRIGAIHEKFCDDLEVEIRKLMLEVQPLVGHALALAQGLETLGYRRYLDEAFENKRYFVHDMAKRPTGG